MQLEVVAVSVLGEKLRRGTTDLRADRDDLEGDDVGLTRVARSEEIGQAQPPVTLLTRKREPHAVGSIVIEYHDVVAFAYARVVAVDDARVEPAFGLDAIEPFAHARSAVGLDEVVVRRTTTHPPQTPPTGKRRLFVEQVGVVSQRNAL